MMKKEKGFYISLLSGIVCIAVVGAICMNLFAKPEQKEENVPIAEETELVVPTPAAATVETAPKAVYKRSFFEKCQVRSEGRKAKEKRDDEESKCGRQTSF